MAEYFDLELLFGSLLLVAGAVVVGAFTAVCVAGWIGKGRPNPYDFDTHATQAMAILTPDDPQLARVDQWVRDMRPISQVEREREIATLNALVRGGS